jgi:hypothetical protein
MLGSDSIAQVKHLRHQFNHLFDHISKGDIKGFVFQHNSKFISAAVDLFYCFFLLGPSHARLKAFVTQTKLN